METIKEYFLRDMDVMLGRSMLHILRSMDTMITVALIIIPIACILLFVYVFVSATQILEEIFFAIVGKQNSKLRT